MAGGAGAADAAELLDLVEPAGQPARGAADGLGGALPGHRGAQRGGVCSTFLADRARAAPVPVFLQRSPHFRPPKDADAPMIMVGPGTGIAPFRGFLQERRALGHTGRNWLFFGDQRRTENFYYRDDFEDMVRDGFLNRLDLAFSRDQADRVYVQHKMLDYGADLWRWLRRRRALLCMRRRRRMARDVDAALTIRHQDPRQDVGRSRAPLQARAGRGEALRARCVLKSCAREGWRDWEMVRLPQN